jgi:succinyl-CoA synthetase beta subunit
MRLHEYEAKRLFRMQSIAVPPGENARSHQEAEAVARRIGKPVVIKAQVLVGGRGKAGGIQFAGSPQEAAQATARLIGRMIKGEQVEEVLVEERLDIENEIYVGVTIDGGAGAPLGIVSLEGGVDIEETAAKHPERIARLPIDIFEGLPPAAARSLVEDLGLKGDLGRRVADCLLQLYILFDRYDGMLVEINPLVATKAGAVIAADAVFEIDDASLFRHPEFKDLVRDRIVDPLAREGREFGVSYVGLDGDIGVICSGAGLGMATIDLISKWGRPANFLETGGGITADLMAKAMRLVLKKPGLKGLIINLYGGINPIHEGARGVASVIREDRVKIPIVAKALGNFQEETWQTLEEAGVIVVKTIHTQQAVEELFKRIKR